MEIKNKRIALQLKNCINPTKIALSPWSVFQNYDLYESDKNGKVVLLFTSTKVFLLQHLKRLHLKGNIH